jgi:hypothetical protein
MAAFLLNASARGTVAGHASLISWMMRLIAFVLPEPAGAAREKGLEPTDGVDCASPDPRPGQAALFFLPAVFAAAQRAVQHGAKCRANLRDSLGGVHAALRCADALCKKSAAIGERKEKGWPLQQGGK